MIFQRSSLLWSLLLLLAYASSVLAAPMEIVVLDEDTGRGVPLVELETVHGVRYVTDSAGVVAFDEPGLMDQRVFFHVRSHGYEAPKDGFGFRGKAIDIKSGGRAEIKIHRTNIAQRLYRITGAGIYRDTVLVGRKPPIERPLLNAQVLGSDSVLTAIYRGKVHWFWGDTNQPGYPLGNFHTPGATTPLPSSGRVNPEQGIDLRYFIADGGFAKETARMPGDGPTWVTSLLVVGQGDDERLYAGYEKIEPPLRVYQRGLARWNDAKEEFEPYKVFPANAVIHPSGHTFLLGDGDDRRFYFNHPFPIVRVRAAEEAVTSLAEYEAYTCLQDGSDLKSPEIDRDDDGRLRYAWRKNTAAVGPVEQQEFVEKGVLEPHEGLFQLRDRDTGKAVVAHRGTVYWNDFRKRWIMIATEIGGSSMLGEVWYSEAPTPVGPWAYGVKIVTHDQYSFYNPKQHPMFDADGGRVVYFEGTYTFTFSGNQHPTPRYDYNQIMYRLELDDERLAIPAAVDQNLRPIEPAHDRFQDFDRHGIAFFAMDRAVRGMVPLSTGGGDGTIYVWPADMASPPEAVVPLYRYTALEEGGSLYSTRESLDIDRYRRDAKPVGLVWPSPWRR